MERRTKENEEGKKKKGRESLQTLLNLKNKTFKLNLTKFSFLYLLLNNCIQD